MLLPIKVEAETNANIPYNQVAYLALDPTNALHNQPWTLSPETPRPVTYKKPSYGRYQCVQFVKDLLGIYGTWGDGARKLSLNSVGIIRDVVIFRYIVHTAAVIDRSGENITIREWVTTRKGAYEQTRVLSVYDPSILGFHKF